MVRLLALLVLVALLAGSAPASAAPAPPIVAPTRGDSAARGDKLVLALYYPWFDANTWTEGVTADLPAEPYTSADPGAIRRHVDQAAAAGIDGFISAWWGPGNQTDDNFAQLLEQSRGTLLRHSLYIEPDAPTLASRNSCTQAVRYAIDRYGGDPSFLTVDGSPVLFFWRPRALPGGGSVGQWRALRDEVDPERRTTWIAEGDDFAYLAAFDGINPYSIAWSASPEATLRSYGSRARSTSAGLGESKLWIGTAMPGYDDRLARPGAGGFARPRGDGDYYWRSFTGAISSGADWIVITSWNEWVEGSQIEPSVTYGSFYLDLTRELVASFKGG